LFPVCAGSALFPIMAASVLLLLIHQTVPCYIWFRLADPGPYGLCAVACRQCLFSGPCKLYRVFVVHARSAFLFLVSARSILLFLSHAVRALFFWGLQTVPCYFWYVKTVSLISQTLHTVQLHCCFWSTQAVPPLLIAKLEYVCPNVAGPVRREQGLVFT
jgi:hypothetical protein